MTSADRNTRQYCLTHVCGCTLTKPCWIITNPAHALNSTARCCIKLHYTAHMEFDTHCIQTHVLDRELYFTLAMLDLIRTMSKSLLNSNAQQPEDVTLYQHLVKYFILKVLSISSIQAAQHTTLFCMSLLLQYFFYHKDPQIRPYPINFFEMLSRLNNFDSRRLKKKLN